MIPLYRLDLVLTIVGGTLRYSQVYLGFSAPVSSFLRRAVQQFDNALSNIDFWTYIREGWVGRIQNDAKAFIFGDFC